MIKVMTRRFFTVAFPFFFTITSFCEREGFTIKPFSPLKLHKDFRKEHYLKQHFDDTLPSFSPPEIMDRFIVKEAKNRPYNHLGGFNVRFKELAKPSCTAFFFSSSNQFREKYFFDVAFDGAVEFSERNEKKFFYDSSVMLRYKELGFVSFSLNEKEEEKNTQACPYISSFATHFPLPFFSEGIFIAKIKSYIVASKRAGKKPSSSVSTFSLKINKIRFLNRRFFDSSYEEYFRFLFNIEGVNKCDECRLSQLLIFRDEFFFSFKPEYVIETSKKIQIIGKLNFIFPKYKSGNDKAPAWENPSVYPGIDIEYKKNENLILFFRTNNGCSFYDNYYYFYDSTNNKILATEGLSYDRLNMEAGLSRIYNSNFKYSLSLPIHWKQNVEIFKKEENIVGACKKVIVNENFDFFISPFFSFDLSLCRRKIVVFFKNSMNIKIPSKGKIISEYIPFNDLSFKVSCRFRTNHTIFFSLQCKTFFISKSKHIFSLAFEYNYYLSESLLFFIRMNNIERLLFDKLLVKMCGGIFPNDQFEQELDIFKQERESFSVDIGFKIPM